MHAALVTTAIPARQATALGLADRLAEQGHRATVLCPRDLATEAARRGHGFVELRADRDAIARLRRPRRLLDEGRVGAALVAGAGLPAVAWRARRATVRGAELRAAMASIEPDVVVCDAEAHVAILAGAASDRPMALLTTDFALEEHPGVPPMNSSLGPDDPDAIHEAWEVLRTANRRWHRDRRRSRAAVVDRLAPVTYTTTSPVALAAVARRSGFDLATRSTTRAWPRPFLHHDLTMLVANLWELEFPHDPPADRHYVGPLVDPHRAIREPPAKDRQAWEALRERRSSGPDRPLLYCGLGSLWSSHAVRFAPVIDAFRRRPERDLVLGLGGQVEPDQLGDLPANVTALGWAPQTEILAEVDAAIVHGGNASVSECLQLGVPMVVLPAGHLDQPGSAARVDHAGIGLVGTPETDAEGIDRLVSRVLEDPAPRRRIAALRDLTRDPARRTAAVDLLEQIALGSAAGRRC